LRPTASAAAQCASATHSAANADAADSSKCGCWCGTAAATTDLIARDGDDAIADASDRHDASNDARG
jgi:hypothetical protein